MYQNRNLCFEVEDFMKKGKSYENLHKFIDLLLDQEQVIKIWSDGEYISVEYDYDDPNIAEAALEWVNLNKEYVGVYKDDVGKDIDPGDEVPPPENIKFFEEESKIVS